MKEGKRPVHTALSIAGSDSSGGAGIQADLKTMTALGIYGMTAITALTAQNTTGVSSILEVAPGFLAAQLDAVFTDIVPDAVKIGMLASAALAETAAERLRYYHAENIVLDPVLVSTSGCELSEGTAAEAMKRVLCPISRLITPNIPEAEALLGQKIGRTGAEKAAFPGSPQSRGSGDLLSPDEAALRLSEELGCAVLLKGGHAGPARFAVDRLAENGRLTYFEAPWIETDNTHGTGCTLSSAIACGLAGGRSLEESIRLAKRYLTGALSFGLSLGKGAGPLWHGYLQAEESEMKKQQESNREQN